MRRKIKAIGKISPVCEDGNRIMEIQWTERGPKLHDTVKAAMVEVPPVTATAGWDNLDGEVLT